MSTAVVAQRISGGIAAVVLVLIFPIIRPCPTQAFADEEYGAGIDIVFEVKDESSYTVTKPKALQETESETEQPPEAEKRQQPPEAEERHETEEPPPPVKSASAMILVQTGDMIGSWQFLAIIAICIITNIAFVLTRRARR